MRKEQTQWRRGGEVEIQPFGDCWIEQAMRRKYTEATTVLKEDLRRRKEALVVSGGGTQKAGKKMECCLEPCA